jgi:peptide methionine sulfoxide reductase msrA/msrB
MLWSTLIRHAGMTALVCAAALGGCRRDADGADPATPIAHAAARAGGPSETDDTMKAKTPGHSASNYDIAPLPREKVAELAKKLSPEAFRVTQKAGTEPPFCGTLLDNKKDGIYCCIVCGLPLFSSEHKFNSGTGWPSFFREFDPQHVARKSDHSAFMARVEINCARCDAHLGHVFDDGPKPTGERHCLNSASLVFHEKGSELPPESRPAGAAAAAVTATATVTASSTGAAKADASGQLAEAYFAGGCFWGLEHYFQQGPGVVDAVSGYMQGRGETPTYKQVSYEATGHAETVKVVYDPAKISYRRLLEAFFTMHDPTQLNRQGPDVGDQYRSGIWYTSEAQQREAEAFIQELTTSGRYGSRKIVTQLEPAKTFWPAEDYHQDYVQKTGRACHVKNPW